MKKKWLHLTPRSSLGKWPKAALPNCAELGAWPCSVHDLFELDMPYLNLPRRSKIEMQLDSGSMMIISLLGRTAMEQPGLTCRLTRLPSLVRSTGALDALGSSSMEDWLLRDRLLLLNAASSGSVCTSLLSVLEASVDRCGFWSLAAKNGLGACNSWIMRMSVCDSVSAMRSPRISRKSRCVIWVVFSAATTGDSSRLSSLLNFFFFNFFFLDNDS